tara:strand:- start:578 stop:1588 length:1011 start_codon:yes stop_codon:yes gene_type:complete
MVSISFSLIITELIIKNFYPQNLTGSWGHFSQSGLLMNKNKGSAKHQVGSNIVKYNFGKYHSRITNLDKISRDKKILWLGSSYSFGWLLKDEDTFVYKLNKNYKNINIINPSTGGWTTENYEKYFKLYCEKIKPFKTVMIIHDGDFNFELSNFYILDKENRITEIKTKITRYQKIKNKISGTYFYQFLIENFHTLSLIRRIFSKTYIAINEIEYNKFNTQNKLSEEDRKYGLQLFDNIKKNSNKCNTSIVVIYIGWYHGLNDEIQKGKRTYEMLNYLLNNKYFNNENFQFINLSNDKNMIEIRKNFKKYIIPNEGGHPNTKGSELIYRALKKNIKF